MFDCPEQTQTSPKSTPRNVRVVVAIVAEIVWTVVMLASVGGSFVRHVCVLLDDTTVANATPSKDTVIRAFAGANPHTIAAAGACWSTMSAPRVEANRNLPETGGGGGGGGGDGEGGGAGAGPPLVTAVAREDGNGCRAEAFSVQGAAAPPFVPRNTPMLQLSGWFAAFHASHAAQHDEKGRAPPIVTTERLASA